MRKIWNWDRTPVSKNFLGVQSGHPSAKPVIGSYTTSRYLILLLASTRFDGREDRGRWAGTGLTFDEINSFVSGLPEFSEEMELEGASIDIEYYRIRDDLTGEDFFEVRYRFPDNVTSEMCEFRENESRNPRFYGICPFVDKYSSPTEVWISVPVGYDNHQTPIEEVQRVAHGLADLADNYL